MADTILALTSLGQALKAKIELGDGSLPLVVTKIVSAAGSSPYPEYLNDLVDPRLEFSVTGSEAQDGRTTITAVLTNIGNDAMDIPPLQYGYPLAQIGFYAMDPDYGEILYRVSQFDNPIPVPAASERGWTYEPTFEIVTGNAATVIIEAKPAWLVSRGEMNAAIEGAVKGKANKPDPYAEGHVGVFDAAGDLKDGGKGVADLAFAVGGLPEGGALQDADALPYREAAAGADRRATLGKLLAWLRGKLFGAASGLLKADGAGGVSAAQPGADYDPPGAAQAAQQAISAHASAGNPHVGSEPSIAAGSAAQYLRGDKQWAALNAAAVGLGNVANEGAVPKSDIGAATGGTLGVARGGTGRNALADGEALVGAGAGAVASRPIKNNTATSAALVADAALVTQNTLRYHTNRLSSVAAADTGYATCMARGIVCSTTDLTAGTSALTNGTIYLVYE